MRPICRLVAASTVVLTATGLAVAAGAPAQAAPSAGLVVSEAYGGGGNSGATLKNDFIELQNKASSALNLSGYSVQYLPAAASASSTWQVTSLSGSAPASGHYLVQEAAGTAGTDNLPTPDATGTINMSGTVALVHGTTALTCTTTTACAADTSIVDLVGWNGAAVHEGTAAAATTNSTSVQRAAAGTDTDDNAADFTVAAPTPQNSGTGSGGGTTPTPTPTPDAVRIHDIQGTSFVSPLVGKQVSGVAGIVTATRTSASKGFWMQDPMPDDNPATSEGVFVYTSGAPGVQPGDAVRVDATVSEYYPLAGADTTSSTSNLSITELTKPTVSVLSSGNTLPAPVVLGPGTVPDTYAPDLGGGNIEKTPITPARSALDFYESVEGMRVEVDDARVVGPTDSYGEQYVTTKPTQDRTYRGGTQLRGENRTPSGRLEVVALSGANLGLDVGDVLRGATVGPVDYSLYGGYVLAASTVGAVEHNGLAPVTAAAAGRRQLSIATYNVENLSPKDPQTKFDALARGVVTNLARPDIVALEEIQDNDGSTDDGVTSADRTLDQLTAAIVTAGGPHYAYREIDPVNDHDGGQPGGNIRVAFLFDPTKVTFVDAGAASADRSTTGTAVTSKHGRPALTLSPGRIDPTNPVWTSSRKPLVGQFRFADGRRTRDVFVIANHFDAKLGDQNADGRYQYPAQSSAVQRAGQAQLVHDFTAKLLAVDKHARVVVVGDLNDYQFSPALAALRTGTADGSGTPILSDLITTLPTDQQYTYVYDGVSQVLDHILVTPGVRGVRYQVVHVNAEFHDQVSDHDPQVVDLRP